MKLSDFIIITKKEFEEVIFTWSLSDRKLLTSAKTKQNKKKTKKLEKIDI